MPLLLGEMQSQPILGEKIVANFCVAIQQNRNLIAPLGFQRWVLVDINNVQIEGLRGTALHCL